MIFVLQTKFSSETLNGELVLQDVSSWLIHSRKPHGGNGGFIKPPSSGCSAIRAIGCRTSARSRDSRVPLCVFLARVPMAARRREKNKMLGRRRKKEERKKKEKKKKVDEREGG